MPTRQSKDYMHILSRGKCKVIISPSQYHAQMTVCLPTLRPLVSHLKRTWMSSCWLMYLSAVYKTSLHRKKTLTTLHTSNTISLVYYFPRVGLKFRSEQIHTACINNRFAYRRISLLLSYIVSGDNAEVNICKLTYHRNNAEKISFFFKSINNRFCQFCRTAFSQVVQETCEFHSTYLPSVKLRTKHTPRTFHKWN